MPTAPGFDYSALLEAFGPARSRFDLDHLQECDSSNSELIRRAAKGAPSGLVIICDRQLAGRGRRGRSWISAPGDSLTFSILWKLPQTPAPSGLSLLVGLAVAQTLVLLGAAGVQLKWPNDIVSGTAKLGGILIETASNGSLVIGIGLNLREHPGWAEDTGRAITSLEALGCTTTREALLGALLPRLATLLDEFALTGFASFRDAWNALDAFSGQAVELNGDQLQVSGICQGAGEDGALLIDTPTGLRTFSAGDLSLRQRQEIR